MTTEYFCSITGKFLGAFVGEDHPDKPIHEVGTPNAPSNTEERFSGESLGWLPSGEGAQFKEELETTVNLSTLNVVNIFEPTPGAPKLRLADASSINTKAHGIVIADWTVGQVATYLFGSVINGFVGLTSGAPVFLSTAGGVTQTPSFGSQYIWQQIGEALSPTKLQVRILDPVELKA